MKRHLFCLLFALLCLDGFAQQFTYNETFKNAKADSIIFGGSPKPAFLTADASKGGTDANGKGYLRLTSSEVNQKGYIYCKIPFASTQGLSISFEYFTYGGGNGADGITFFLFDAEAVLSNSFNIGGFGGSLGYAPYIDYQGTSYIGLSKAYIGVGIDEYGNFKMKREGRTTGITPTGQYDAPPRNSVTVRGPASSNYAFVANVNTKDSAAFNFEIGTGVARAEQSLTTGYRRCYIDLEKISADSQSGYYLTVKMLEGGPVPKLHTLINRMRYEYAPPAQLMYGIASSTGDNVNFHEIRNLLINSFSVNPIPRDDNYTIYSSATSSSFNILANDTAEVGHTIPPNGVFLNSLTSTNGATLSVDTLTGRIKYIPKAGFTGTDQFSYYVVDDRGLKSNGSATVTVTVKAIPVGTDDVATFNVLNATNKFTFNVGTNDQDKTNVTYRVTKSPTNTAGFTFDEDTGIFTYTALKTGTIYNDVFNYRIVDENGIESQDIVVKIILHYPPVANDDTYYIPAYTDIRVAPVVENDYDPDGTTSIDVLALKYATVVNPVQLPEKFYTDGAALVYRSTKEAVIEEFTYNFKDMDNLPSNEAKVKMYIYPKNQIGLSKTAKAVEADNNSYNVTYTFHIKNLNPQIPAFGSENQMVLKNINLVDDLEEAFGSGTAFKIVGVGIVPKHFEFNPQFQGKRINGNEVGIRLLDIASSSLQPGEEDSLSIIVNVPFTKSSSWTIGNQAEVTGKFAKLMQDSIARRSSGDNSLTSEKITYITLAKPSKPTVRDTIFSKYIDDAPFTLDIFKLTQAATGKTILKDSLKIVSLNPELVAYSVQGDQVKFTLTGKPGTAILQYTVRDNKLLLSNTGTITVEIADIPKGSDDLYYTLRGKDIGMDLRKNDGTDSYFYALDLDKTGLQGDVTLNSDKVTYTYKANAAFYGTDVLYYKLRNSANKTSAPVKVSVYVNNPPVARDTTITTSQGQAIEIYVPSLTADLDGTVDPSSVITFNTPTYEGTFTAVSGVPGRFRFEPTTVFKGNASFQYTISDKDSYIKGTSEAHTVTIVVGEGQVSEPSNKIGLAKAVGSVKKYANNSFDVRYVFTVKNYGKETLSGISIKDDLGLVFTGAQFIVKSLTTQGTLVANDSYNGLASTELLDQTKSTLEPGAQQTIELVVTVTLLNKEGLFINTATAEATTPSGTTVKDQSTSGTKADPAGDGDVSPKDPTFVELLFPAIFIPEGFSPNNDGINDTYNITNPNNNKIAMQIFNRWGNRVYKSDDYKNDWNGKCTEGITLGQDLPPGTYFYIIYIDGKDKYTGYITLNR